MFYHLVRNLEICFFHKIICVCPYCPHTHIIKKHLIALCLELVLLPMRLATLKD